MIKKNPGSGITNKNISNKNKLDNYTSQSLESLKNKVYSRFVDRGAVLGDMQLIIKFNKRIRFLLSVIDIFKKYPWVIPLKDKKGIIITNGFQKILDESNWKPNKIWIGKSKKFYNRSMKSWLEKNAIEMYSINNKGKSIVAERFIRTLKNKIYKYMTSITKMCILINEILWLINITMHIIPQLKWNFISDLKGEQIVGTFYKNELQKTKQEELRTEEVINYMLNGKAAIILLTVGLIKKTLDVDKLVHVPMNVSKQVMN